ncbi:MAG: S-layer homology domain-containing protein, partial [Oscillospiraceae bacterium]|nr:S-layer homology domain-containing protein [Oscillospiraceae bacterium]
MRNTIIRRLLSATLTAVMAVSLSVSALAAGPACTAGCPTCASTKTVSRSVELPLVTSFSDVPSTHTFHDAIVWCAGQGIVGGYSDGTFRPANTVSRSNFVVMLSQAFFPDDVATYSTPNYLANGSFYPNYIAMQMAGALNNTSFAWDLQNTSEMNKGISRYDMAQLMTNIMTKKGFSASSADKSAAIAKITDYNSIPSQYKDAVANVYSLGIIGGYSSGYFSGDSTVTRQVGAIVMYRMLAKCDMLDSEVGTPDPEVPIDPG